MMKFIPPIPGVAMAAAAIPACAQDAPPADTTDNADRAPDGSKAFGNAHSFRPMLGIVSHF